MVVARLFCFIGLVPVGSADLVADFFDEGQWNLCQRECQRALHAGEEPQERFLLLNALCGVRRGVGDDISIQQLDGVLKVAQSEETIALAEYERGHLLWRLGRKARALDSFARTFMVTTNHDLFLHAACSAFLLLDESPALGEGRTALIDQINTSRDQWYGELFADIRKKQQTATVASRSPDWVIRFYRSNIGPAIGSRCVLDPSCSEYFHRAKCKHGWLAYPMIADRFAREPGVSNAGKDPVIKGGRVRYRDPVSHHDFWMENK